MRVHYHTLETDEQPRSARRVDRAGYLYVAVLFTTLLVVASVAASLSLSTTHLRRQSQRSERVSALQLAESEIHRMAAIMQTSSAWRTTWTHNVFSNWRTVTVTDPSGNRQLPGSVRHRFFDSDGSLDDDPWDNVELTVHAKIGESESTVTVGMEPTGTPLALLQYGVTATDDIEINDGGSLNVENAVQVLDDCKTSTSGILTTPRLELGGYIQFDLRSDLASASVTLPTEDVVAAYAAVGTEIPRSSIPVESGNLVLRDILLTKNANPYGPTDPAGIYWIDANGKDVLISNCRIEATLVIDNGSEVLIDGGINWCYPGDPDAILVTDERITFEDVEATLDEAARGVNFNPAGSPYRGTLSNATTVDIYPTELRGLIYTTDHLIMEPLIGNGYLHLTGAIVCNDLRVRGYVHIKQLDELNENVPLGLADPVPMRFRRGTFRRTNSP